MQENSRIQGHLFGAFSVLVWGTTFVSTKVLLRAFTPLEIMVARFTLGFKARTIAAKMACADGIQEYIETLRDLKASNAEQRYLSGLSGKIRAVEKQSIAAELETALFVSSASMVLKLGIASVALTGSVLLVQGSIDVLTLFLFLMAASRMYDPMQGRVAESGGGHRHAHQCGADERDSGRSPADRQRAADQSGL